MMEHRVVSDDGLIVEPGGCAIDVRLPWYRSLPLSVVEVKEVSIDDEAIDASALSFELGKHSYSLNELRARTDTWWYVLDSAFLHVQGRHIDPGSKHKVAVTIAVRPPYINGLNRIVRTEKLLAAREGAIA